MLVVGFLVVSVAAYVFYFILPQMEKQQSITVQLNTTKSTLQTLKAKADRVEQLKTEIASLSSELDQKTGNIPHGTNDTKILLYLKALAEKTGNDIAITFADKPSVDGAFLRRTVALDSLTSYAKLSGLLNELDKAALYNKVQIISASYEPINDSPAATEPPTGTDVAEPIPADPGYTLNSHIEIYFYAFPLQQGEQPPAPLMPSSIRDRTTSLFPD
jgi:hypothetical protein